MGQRDLDRTVVLPVVPAGGRPSFGYQPALDGIRAFAVAAVLLFHAGIGFVAGGFLGVDAFFVLSGFLITSLLLTERLRTGRINLTRFWLHRARRLLPALLAMLLATVVAGHYLLDSDALGLLRADAYAALAYVANWRMIFRGTGYVAATAAPSPLQHTWSLGIEEQFYWIWPLLIAGLLVWLAGRRARVVLLVFCLLGTAGSALLCARFFDPDSISRSYYGADTRAQALLIGAALAAVLTPTGARVPARHRGASRHLMLGALALAGAATTLWLWHAATDTARWMFDGGLTVAALATAFVIAHAVVSPRSPTARFLALPPLVALGRISYGVYLWHWPLFSFLTADLTGLSRWPLLAVRLLGTFGLSLASYHLIEQPIRRGALHRLLPRRVPSIVTAGTFALMVVAITVSTAPPPQALAAAPVILTAPRAAAKPSAPILRASRPKSAGEPRITFFGDSVSWVIGAYLPKHPGLWTSDRAIEGCGIATLPRILQLGTPHTNYPGCTNWPARWQSGVDKDNPDVAVIELNRWELMDRFYQGRYQHVGDPAYNQYLLAQLDRAVGIAGSKGAAVVILTAAYTHRAERPDGSLYPEDQPARVDAWNALVRQEAARRPGKVTVLDLNKVVCPDGRFTWQVGGLRIRSDGLHYTTAGVQDVIAPWLLPKLAAIARGTYLAAAPAPRPSG